MTESALERRLRYALLLSRIRWKKRTKTCWGQVDSLNGQHIITLPLGFDEDYLLRGLLHELCHVTVPSELGAFGVFEEDILERVLEPRMMDYIHRHPRVQQWWLRKLREAKGDK